MIRLILILSTLSTVAHFDDGDWRKDMEKIATGHCLNHPSVVGHVGQVNPALLMLTCHIGDSYNGKIIVHSGRRFSKHHYGNAIDFRIDLTSYKDRCAVYTLFQEQYLHILRVLADKNLLEYVGLGLYPDQITPFFHLDMRGRKARWSRIGKEYLGIQSGELYIQNELDQCKGDSNGQEKI